MKDNKILKFAFEFVPLLVFFYFNNAKISLPIDGFPKDPIFTATAAFILCTILSLVGMYSIMRKIPIMPLVSGVFVLIFGGLTIYLKDDIFIKMKPTLVNLLFGALLLIGLKFKKIFLQILFEDAFDLTADGWHGLTIRWGSFFILLAFINELVWRNFSTDFWAGFKIWGVMPLTFLFIISQVAFLQRHIIEKKD